jgi:hypothetical protein
VIEVADEFNPRHFEIPANFFGIDAQIMERSTG